jgi:hypothetical protein
MSWPSCINRVSAEAMSSCNALPQRWAIKPTKTTGCASKRSCNGAVGALQESFGDDALGVVADVSSAAADPSAGKDSADTPALRRL